PGFRYHLVSIIAILLALGVGMIVGSSFVQPAVVDKMSRQLFDLRRQFKDQVQVVQESNRQYQDLVGTLTPRLVEGKLSGLRIALVQTGDYPETASRVRDAFQQAGATVASMTIV